QGTWTSSATTWATGVPR
ncbi:hypothetical protein HaLaN_31566, partial [Haematococcus lacustris]